MKMQLDGRPPEPEWVLALTGGQPLIHCDNMEMLSKIPNGAVDLIVTSPPYPNLRGASGKGVIEWFAEITPRLLQIVRVLNQRTGVLVLNVAFPRSTGFYDDRVFYLTSIVKAAANQIYGTRSAGLVDIYAWDKLNPAPSGNMRRADIPGWEPIFVIAMSPDYTFNPHRRPYNSKTLGKLKEGNSTRAEGVGNNYTGGHSEPHPEGARQTNVLRISSSGDQDRPRAKGGSFPRELAARFVAQYAPPDAVCVDPWAGVGTFVLQAILAGHSAFGCDLDGRAVVEGAKWIQRETAKPVQTPLF